MNDKWTESYALIMPMLGVVIGTLGVALSLLVLKRSQGGVSGMRPPVGVDVDVPKVRYSDGNVLVEVREPGEFYPITGFVQSYDPVVAQAIRGALYG